MLISIRFTTINLLTTITQRCHWFGRVFVDESKILAHVSSVNFPLVHLYDYYYFKLSNFLILKQVHKDVPLMEWWCFLQGPYSGCIYTATTWQNPIIHRMRKKRWKYCTDQKHPFTFLYDNRNVHGQWIEYIYFVDLSFFGRF